MIDLAWRMTTSMASVAARRLRRGPRRPGWSLQLEGVIEFLRRDWESLERLPAPELRRELERRPVPRTARRRVHRRADTLGGLPAEWFEPPAPASDALIFYLHGGSYCVGSTRTHADLIARHALALSARAVGVDYRLAPEHPYPAALDDALAAYRALLAAGHAPGKLAVAGESAGGGLVILLLLALRDRKLPLPAAAVAISPWLDLSESSPSVRDSPDDYGAVEMLLEQARWFAGELPLDDPRISPLFAQDLSRLPPLLVQVGGAERLRDETARFVEAVRRAGGDAALDVLPEMPHAAQLLAEWSDEGQRAIERAAAFLAARTGGRLAPG